MPIYSTKPTPEECAWHFTHPHHPTLRELQPTGYVAASPYYPPSRLPNPHGHHMSMQPLHRMLHSQVPEAMLHMNVIPPTPLEKGKQKAAQQDVRMQSPVPDERRLYPSPSLPLSPSLIYPTLPPSPSPLPAALPSHTPEFIQGAIETKTQRQDTEMPWADSVSSGTDGSSSGCSVAMGRTGCMKDAAIADSNETYKVMDKLLHGLGERNDIPFRRLLKAFNKRHNNKIAGDNPWNIYTKLHTHPDHHECELSRTGCSVSAFDTLGYDDQQRVRSDCWAEFQKTFVTPGECRMALEIFSEICSFDNRGKGTTITARQKQFNTMVNKMSKIVSSSVCISPISHLVFN